MPIIEVPVMSARWDEKCIPDVWFSIVYYKERKNKNKTEQIPFLIAFDGFLNIQGDGGFQCHCLK